LSSFSQAKEKQKHKKNKMQRKKGTYLSSLASAFGMKHSSCLLLSMFLPEALHLSQALCLTSP
jgi:hypothetical protein